MFQAVIVEDEEPILDLMKLVIGRNGHYAIAGAFTNPFEALSRLDELRPDVAFLDVEMPRLNGLDLARKIHERTDHTQIVFTTAYKQYALNAFEVQALDYIVKPVTPAAIERVTERLVKQLRYTSFERTEKMATIRCFGGFEVCDMGGAPVRFPTRLTEELFAYFLCHSGKDIGKWRLAEMLWPNVEEKRASHNLHNTIYRLKKVLKKHELGLSIEKSGEGYRLDTGNMLYDVLAFQRHDADPSKEKIDPAQAERLSAMHGGTLLEGKPYLWKIPLEEAYGKLYTSLVRELVKRDMSAQAWGQAQRRLDQYLTIYPLQEDANMMLIEIYARQGLQENIQRHYAKFVAAYRRELGLEPPQTIKAQAASCLGKPADQLS